MSDRAARLGATRRRFLSPPRVDQRGFTLIEVLLVVGITGLLLGPLLAWTVLVMRQQPVEQDGMIRTAQASLLRTHFASDVASAGRGDDYSETAEDPRWETWRQECIGGGGQDGRALLVLVAQRGGLIKTIYSVAPARDGSDDMALWRDRCAADTGRLIDTTQVVERVLDEPDRTSGACHEGQQDGDADTCRRVSLQVAVPDAVDLVELSATRRADARSLDRDAQTGNLLPIAVIDVERVERIDDGTLRVAVELWAGGSYDPDGEIVEYRWELPTAPEPNAAYRLAGGPIDGLGPDDPANPGRQIFELDEVGSFTARLTVVDNDGATDTTYRRIATVENRRPDARPSVEPNPVVAGEQLTLDGSASTDLDGTIVNYRWRLRSDLPGIEDLEEFVVVLDEGESTRITTWDVPEWAFGRLIVELIVTDDRGAVDAFSVGVDIQDPIPPPPPDEDPDPNEPDPGEPADPGDPDDPDPEPGAPVAAVEVQIGTNRQVTFDAGDSRGQGLTYEWNFGLLAGTGDGGPVITHQYPAIGTYTARLTVRDDQNRTATRSVTVVIPGQPLAPQNIRVENGALVWSPRPGARRYLVDLESSSNSCARVVSVATGASAQPRRVLPPNPCGADSTVRARVGTEATAGGPIAWSGWVNVPNEVTK